MGMFNTVRRLAMKNKDKVADNVDKATDFVDKKTGGKHRDKLNKVDDAAAKFAGRPATRDVNAPDATADDTPGDTPA